MSPSTRSAGTGVDVRAVFEAAAVDGAPPPYDRVQVRLYYPAAPPSGSAIDTGIVAVDPDRDPMPVVVIAHGLNCGPEGYAWLAHHLAANGYLAVTYAYTAPLSPDSVGSVPENGFAGPASDGNVTRAVLRAVHTAAQRPPLLGAVDPDRTALIGHSAGGRTALYLATDEQLGLGAVIVYGGHAIMPGTDGRPVAPPLAPVCPVLLAYGGTDGVISGSRGRYGVEDGTPWDPAAATFDAMTGSGHNLLVKFSSANHFSVAHQRDDATGRPFLEEPDAAAEHHRGLLAGLFTAFLDRHLRGADEALLTAATHVDTVTSRTR